MLILPEIGAVAFNHRKAGDIPAVVPTAEVCPYKDGELVLVPHRESETKVLRNLGYPVPAPIHYFYEWAGDLEPMFHQKQTAAFITMNQKCAVLNEIGTGKTLSALWAADYLMKQERIKKCLILSPLSTLSKVWDNAIFSYFIHRKAVVLHGTANKRRNLLKKEFDFAIINHDGFQVVVDEMMEMFDMVIIDEAAVYRNAQSNRFKLLNTFLKKHEGIRVVAMTGTPTPNAPTDAWAIMRFVDSPRMPTSFTAMRRLTMDNVTHFKWVPKKNAMETVYSLLVPAIRFNREDCFDLPETMIQTREVELSKPQHKAFKDMVSKFRAEYEEGIISAANEAVKLQKLLQITLGAVYGEDGEVIKIDATPRLKAILEIIEQAGGKVLVFAPFRNVLKLLRDMLEEEGYNAAVIDGEVSVKARNTIFHSFQHDEDGIQVIVAHPGTMAHGLTLTAANTIVWYGATTSNEQYEQANGRIERIGKVHSSNVIHLQATTLEEKMFQRLQDKSRMQGILLDLIEQETEK